MESRGSGAQLEVPPCLQTTDFACDSCHSRPQEAAARHFLHGRSRSNQHHPLSHVCPARLEPAEIHPRREAVPRERRPPRSSCRTHGSRVRSCFPRFPPRRIDRPTPGRPGAGRHADARSRGETQTCGSGHEDRDPAQKGHPCKTESRSLENARSCRGSTAIRKPWEWNPGGLQEASRSHDRTLSMVGERDVRDIRSVRGTG
jgi:hypothetical protein